MRGKTFYRIKSLEWAGILADYAFFMMQSYLTYVWDLSLTHAAAILNIWNGIWDILPVFFLYLVDSYLGHFKLLVFTSISYSIGSMLVFMSFPPILAESTHTCKAYEPECIGDIQVGLFYAGLASIAVGVAGNLVSIEAFLDEQRDINNHNHLKWHQRFGVVVVVILFVLGNVIPYFGAWTLHFGITSICTVLATLGFLSGTCSYRKEPPNPNGSPLCNVCRVFKAAALKIFQPYPHDTQGYHGINEVDFSKTSYLRALHKAAIIMPGEGEDGRWKLCSVAEVEEAKVVVRMAPMWMTFIVCGVISSTGNTYFVEQARNMDTGIGKLNLPIEVLYVAKMSLSYLLKLVGGLLDRIGKVPFLGVALAMVCSVLCCVAAAGTEIMRLKVVRRYGLLDKDDEDVPMSVYWLLFQFVLIGSFDSILETSTDAYYRDECPESLEEYLQHITRAMFGLGCMSSSLCVYVVGKISKRGGRPNWFQKTLNRSRLDCYYWVLAALGSVNLVVFVIVGWRFGQYMKKGGEGGGELDTGRANAENLNGEGESHAVENDVEMISWDKDNHAVENDDVEIGSWDEDNNSAVENDDVEIGSSNEGGTSSG